MSENVAPATPSTTAIDTAATAAAPAAKAEAQPEELFEVPVNGKVKKVPKAELLKRYSLADAADERFNEAAAMRKQAEAIIARARDPQKVIELLEDPSLGLNPEQVKSAFEEWYYKKFVEPEGLSPEEKRARDAEERLKKYELKEKEEQERKAKEEEERMDAEEAKKLQEDIVKLIDTCGLPKTKFTASRIAYWMRVNETKGLNAPPELIVKQVKGEMRGVMDSLVQASDGDVLVELLGKNTVDKLRKYDIDQIKKRREQKLVAPQAPNPTPTGEESRSKQFEKIRPHEVKRRARLFR